VVFNDASASIDPQRFRMALSVESKLGHTQMAYLLAQKHDVALKINLSLG
jgi:hypothetical protein